MLVVLEKCVGEVYIYLFSEDILAFMEITYKGERNYQSVEIEYDPIKISTKLMAFAKRMISFLLWFYLSHRILQPAYNSY